MSDNRIKNIAFIDSDLKKAFDELGKGKYEDRELFKFIQRAIEDLKKSPFCGTRIPSKFWPTEYIKSTI